MANKEAVFSLRVDTGNSVKDVQNFDQSINKLNKDMQETQNTASQSTGTDTFSKKLDEMDKKLASGTLTFREMSKLMKEYQTVAAQTGTQTPVGDRAIKAAASLKDTLTDLQTRTKLLSSDYIALDTAVAGIQTGTAAFQGFQSVVALTGVESEALVQTMVKLQAAQGLVNSVNQIALALNKDAILGIQVRTAWEKIYTAAVGQSTGAMKAFRVALLATGIGAIIAGVALLIANFEKLKDMLSGTSEKQKMLNATMDAYESGAKDAINQTNKVETAFQLAKDGVISKEEALQTYNDTLGDAFGHAKNLEEAESIFVDKTAAYVESAARRAQAAKLIEQAADDQVAALLATEKDNRAWYEKTVGFINDAASAAIDYSTAGLTNVKKTSKNLNNEISKQATKREKARREQSAKNKKNLAADILAETEANDKKKGINNKYNQDKAKKDKAAADKAAAAAKKRREDEYKAEQDRLKNLQDLYNEYLANIEAAETEYYDSLLTQQQREEQAVNDKFYNLIEQAKQHGDDTSVLEAAQAKALADIRKVADDERLAKMAETEQKNLDLLRSYQELVLDEYQYQLIQFEDQQAEKSKKLSEALSAGLITEQQFMDAQLELEKQYAEKEKELNKAKNEAIKESNEKRWEQETKSIEKMLEYGNMAMQQLNAINGLLNQIGQNRLNTIKDQQDAELNLLNEKQKAALNNENLTAEQKTKIEQDFAQQKYQVQLKAFNEEEKIKKAQFARDKSLRIAQAAIDTAGNIITSIKNAGGIPAGIPFGIAAAALGATQIATIAAQKYQGGTAPGAPSLSTSAGASTGAGASTFTANTNAQQTETAGLIGGQGQQGGVTQVVVVESDITNVQNKVSAQQALSTY